MNWRKIANTLMFKLIFAVALGILGLAAVLHLMNQSISKGIFVETFSEAQQKIFNQIDRQFYQFYEDIWNISSTIVSSSSVKSYLVEQDPASVDERRNIYYMQKEMEDTRLSSYAQLNILLVGTDGKSYVYNWTDKLAAPTDDILSDSVTERAAKEPGKLICEYREFGYSDVTKSEPVIVMACAVHEQEKILGYLYISVKEADFREMYNHFTSGTSVIVVLNGDGEVVSSNDPDYLMAGSDKQLRVKRLAGEMEERQVHQIQEKNGNSVERILFQRLQSSNYHLIGIVNPQEAFLERYDMARIVLFTLFAAGMVLLAVIVFVRQQTRPLANLAENMRNVRSGNLGEYVKVEGTEEIRELTETYNQMIRLLDESVQKLIATEKEKRAAEIHALQMQINPHYVYNTLTSIKMLIWQGNAELSTRVIDAFVQLLRNTISNTQEYITVEQEIENLKNYVFINHVRYGEAVKTEYFIEHSCLECLLPKMVLQPFVENAFFHAFPEGKSGTIRVFARRKADKLVFEIADDGVGMTEEQLCQVRMQEKRSRKEHLTGIGINNVDDRLKLLYGEAYGVCIESKAGKGTKVVVQMPAEAERL